MDLECALNLSSSTAREHEKKYRKTLADLSENEGGGEISPSVENTRYFRKIFFRSRDKMFDNLLLLFFPAPVYGGGGAAA